MENSKQRLAPEIFDIPVQKIRRGHFTARYFCEEKEMLEKREYYKKALMQIFQKNNAVLCGTDEVIAVLKLCSGFYKNPEVADPLFHEFLEQERLIRRLFVQRDFVNLRSALLKKIEMEMALDALWEDRFQALEIRALHDRDRIQPWETVMTIKGLPQYFAHLESVYLGILTRRTLVATNVAGVVEAAQGKPVLFFADRFDHYGNQTGDGYAAMCNGAHAVATDNMGEWWGNRGTGTMPHALIACFGGNTVAATLEFAEQYPKVPCISLVDFENDCVNTSIYVARAFEAEGLKLWGVRLDTSENMVDASIYEYGQMGSEKPTGVNPLLVDNVRRALDQNGFGYVKIVVSGGFTKEKIAYFEKNNVPVDAYGCGSSLLKGNNDFTADVVMVDNKACSKAGRWFRPNARMTLVN